ncbi:hypothetical protein B0T17DRAFT_82033 [Bombardia bombarda]|uniref:Chitin-binding type-1 domain-containing protein n=1 Tax=Bombardia bombarda TaxID=252184 RepID=A0AA39XLX1_9PEZI|nr:hypothetical protein B0T17DRAFT_82033 [Bombardia bombarda]
MLSFIAALLLFPAALAGVLPTSIGELDMRAVGAVSPNLTCGTTLAGQNNGYTCPGGNTSCCSVYGYCGTGDAFCLTTAGCQSRYSNASSACYTPKSGVSISVDGTCGAIGAGKAGYRCPTSGATCCSGAGYCGNTTDHCDVAKGCQAGFGTCARTARTDAPAGSSRQLF